MRQGSGFGIVLGLLLGTAAGAGLAYYVTHYVLDRPVDWYGPVRSSIPFASVSP